MELLSFVIVMDCLGRQMIALYQNFLPSILADSYNSLCPCMQRTKVISDLLISVSKAERQEARLKVRQDSLRLGNVGVIRYCISCFTLLYL